MPSFVIVEKCDGCKALDKTACQYICPNDLMVLESEPRPDGQKKAYNQEPDQCWECYNCVKICPQQAIEVRHYADIMPLGSSTIPLRGTDNIMWTIKFRDRRPSSGSSSPSGPRRKVPSIASRAKPCPATWPASRNPVSSPARPGLSSLHHSENSRRTLRYGSGKRIL
jgi:adenylylsulfate reductase subunit B